MTSSFSSTAALQRTPPSLPAAPSRILRQRMTADPATRSGGLLIPVIMSQTPRTPARVSRGRMERLGASAPNREKGRTAAAAAAQFPPPLQQQQQVVVIARPDTANAAVLDGQGLHAARREPCVST